MILDLERFHALIKEKEEKEGRKITYKILAEESGVSKHSIDDYHRVKNGKQNPISITSLVKFGRYFNVHPYYLRGHPYVREDYHHYEMQVYEFYKRHGLIETIISFWKGDNNE